MADDFTLLQAIADAGGNASGSCSIREARQFLAMLRIVQAHDAFTFEKKKASKKIPVDTEEDHSPVRLVA